MALLVAYNNRLLFCPQFFQDSSGNVMEFVWKKHYINNILEM